jgi:hypothetical protein
MSEKKKTLNWKKSNFLKSKQGNLIVVNNPNHTDDEVFFTGTIIYAEESETNNVLDYSTHYRKDKFELLEIKNVKIELFN